MNADYVIAIPVYNGVDLIDVAAPYEIFKWMANLWNERVRVYLVAENQSAVKTGDDLEITPHKTFDMVSQVNLLWIPGADFFEALEEQMRNVNFVRFIQSRSQTAQYVTSVCTGALLAADAGLLDGYEATTHWAFIERLKMSYPKVSIHPGHPRFVHDRNRVTGGGISSGVDEALYLVKLIAGEEIAEDVQVTTQYFPDPPVFGKIPGSGTRFLEALRRRKNSP
jgi:cyclohexyl-isocyanide hydratase